MRRVKLQANVILEHDDIEDDLGDGESIDLEADMAIREWWDLLLDLGDLSYDWWQNYYLFILIYNFLI